MQNFVRNLFATTLGLGLLSLAPAALAQTAPDAMVKNITQEVIAIVKQDKDIQAGNRQKIYALVDAKVLPFFDFTRMTQLAVGRNWKQATPDQQKALTTEFRNLLVRTYSSAISSYRDQTIDFKPLRAQPTDTEVTVRTVVNQPRGEPINIDYSMEKAADGWKVFDVAVGGVSLVTNYREEFSNQVKAGGIDGLIKTLQSKNQAADPGAKSGSK
jgi:phospholipid transport system substrate-binding protein